MIDEWGEGTHDHANVLGIDIADDAVNRFIRGLIVGIEQGVRIAVEAFCCHLLLVGGRDQLEEPRFSVLSRVVERENCVTCELDACVGSKLINENSENPFCVSVPGASPIAASFCLL